MAFNPGSIGITNSTVTYPSTTKFTLTKNVLNVVSDGDPFPALAGSENTNLINRTFLPNENVISDQQYNYNFIFRAGQNTQAPEEAREDPIGIFANGVVAENSILNSTRLPGSNIDVHGNLTFNRNYFANAFGIDSAGGYPNKDSAYRYINGNFLKVAWQDSLLRNSNVYYSQNVFATTNDHLRHPDGHSKVIGYAFDGYPIYGPYGYSNPTDRTSRIRRMESGYDVKSNDNHRPLKWKFDAEIVANGTTYVLGSGAFIEDFFYNKRKGDLDEHNGRFCVTPDYPEGTYAYFITFEDDDLAKPAYPYIIGPSTRQTRNFVEAVTTTASPVTVQKLWNVSGNTVLTTVIERNEVDIILPIINFANVTTELISGSLPLGSRLENNRIVGTVYEVAYNTESVFVIRARYEDFYEDRTLKIITSGPDNPEWITNEGLLPVGRNQSYFILDNEFIDFQLIAIDDDLPAGDVLEYFIENGDGELPPGITLTDDGRLRGVVEPLLALDKRFQGGGYDTMPYGDFPLDYSVLSSNGYGSFFYDTTTFDYNVPTQSLKKLNRYYPFIVTVTDGDTFVKREFNVYVVGDDYLRADNTVMQVGTGIFTADATHIRNPVWITPRDLGFKRANNYVTLYLDIIDNPTLSGTVVYTLEDVNDDGSPSELPPGLELTSLNGEIVGRIPYQPAVTQDYKFTVSATRITGDTEIVEIVATFYEDTLLGNTSFKIKKTNLINVDGINDLRELRGRQILLYDRSYNVINVDDSNPNYDVVFLDETLAPAINLIMSRRASAGQNYLFVDRLNENNKLKYQNRTLRFGESESYNITDITPYLQYRISQADPATDPILPANAPVNIESQKTFFLNDYVIYTVESGGDGFIYKCTDAHTVQPQLDAEDQVITDIDGNIQIDFESSKWTLVSETLAGLPIADRIAATRQALSDAYGGEAYISVVNQNEWLVTMRSTALSRITENVRSFFLGGDDSTQIFAEIIKNNEDRILLNSNLSRTLNQGRNIGIALFQQDAFFKNIQTSSTDEVDIPSTSKTFELRVIGEIDTNIKWLTEPYLGTINANFTSSLRVEAETTVPDTVMIYTLKSGKLPFGMFLNYDGELIGAPNQFPTETTLGLTTFDAKAASWDGSEPGDTTFDRRYEFTVEARDRFNYTAIEQTFILDVADLDDTIYTDIVFRPMLKPEQRNSYIELISDPEVFTSEAIYRPNDGEFGIQRNLEMLLYAGIEAKDVDYFVSAVAKNAKRKRYKLNGFKKAVAKEPGTDKVVYEVIYIDVLDPAEPKTGKARNNFLIANKKKITVDSISYAVTDDNTNTGAGYPTLPIYSRDIVKFIFAPRGDKLLIQTRDGAYDLDVDEYDFLIDIRDSDQDITVLLQKSDTEPFRARPETNTIKADSDAIKVSDGRDIRRYISSVSNMRENIEAIGKKERNYLPLWMRTPQEGFQELDYTKAIPVCYCKPGTGDDVLLALQNKNYDVSQIDFEIDRMIVKRTEGVNEDQYIIFQNYQFNV
jgi:hypothetical protein